MRPMFMFCSTALLACTGIAEAKQDWPSYNRTLTGERFSTLTQINGANVTRLTAACTYDTGQITAFQSGLVQLDGALFATTEHDTFSLDPDTCKLNWRVREEFKASYLGAQRGVAILDGRVFRGAADGKVYAYDEKTGRRLWATEIATASAGETVPASPIAWRGLVFIGNAGGDNRGVKGRMYALDAETGRIVWEFYLVPKAVTDRQRGPQGAGAPSSASWRNSPGVEVTGGGTWTSYTLDPDTGLLYIPGGNPAPDFAQHLREGANEYAGSVVVLDAMTGAYRRHVPIVTDDFHDYDVSSPPVLLTTRKGAKVMAITPKDGFLYGFDLTSGRRLYRTALTTQVNTSVPLSIKGVRFCPGTQGGSEWNGPAYDSAHDAILSGQVDWCATVHLDPDDKTKGVAAAQPWTGSSADGFGKMDDPSRWAGWLVSSNAITGTQRWRFRVPNPVLGAVTPTAGNLVFFGDMGGNLFALDAGSGAQLWSQKLDGAVSGGVITYDTGAGQRLAVATGMTSKIWPTPKVTAKIIVFVAK